MSSEIKWYCGTAIVAPRPVGRMVEVTSDVYMPARRQGKTFATAMARRGRTLADAIRDGTYKSAWGDNDTPDYVGLSGRESSVTGGTHLNPAVIDRQRLEKEIRDEERRAELERQRLVKLAQEAERRAKEAGEIKQMEKIAQAAVAQEALEELEGFGSF